MPERLYKVIGQVFGVPVENITPEDGPATIKAWDSLAHINLLLALEEEFGVSFSPEDSAEMLSVGAIREMLGSKSADGVEPETGRG